MNNEKGEDLMEDIKMISAEELFDKYDEIINITMVNLYTLTKEKGEIIVSDFDRKNRDHLFVIRVALMAKDIYGFPLKMRCGFWDWIALNWKMRKLSRFIPRDNQTLPVVNVEKLLEFMYPPIKEYMGENFKFEHIFNQFYGKDFK